MSVGFGMIFGLACWLDRALGHAASLADAALPAAVHREVFVDRLDGWVGSLQPAIIVPLVLLAIGWTIWRAREDARAGGRTGIISIWCCSPFPADHRGDRRRDLSRTTAS